MNDISAAEPFSSSSFYYNSCVSSVTVNELYRYNNSTGEFILIALHFKKKKKKRIKKNGSKNGLSFSDLY